MEIKKIFENWIARNIILAVVAVIAVVVAISILLNLYTQHGKEITVPDMTNLTVAEAQCLASAAGVQLQVSDSLYMNKVRKGAVVNQNPPAGSKVKHGRRVSVSINAIVPKKVKMPGLVGCSMRQAKAELAARGLVLGRLIYVSDIATNNVLRQLYRGSDIAAGKEISSGSTINLVLGLDSADGRTYIPNLHGMKYLQAVDVIHESSLNVASLKFDSSVHNYADSLNAVVYAQRPAATGFPVVMGAEVSISLTVDESKINPSK